jgi:hypothetical protein
MAQGATQSSDLRSPTIGVRSASSGWVLAGDRPAGTVQFEEEMVSFFVDAAELLGVPKSVAAIYGIIFASPSPLSFSEISSRLDFSNGSISQGLKALREIGAIRVVVPSDVGPQGAPNAGTSNAENRMAVVRAQKNRRTGEGRSRDRFEPDLELRKLILRFLDQKVQRQLRSGQSRLAELTLLMPKGKNSGEKTLQIRLYCLEQWHKKARALLPVARTFLRLTPG